MTQVLCFTLLLLTTVPAFATVDQPSLDDVAGFTETLAPLGVHKAGEKIFAGSVRLSPNTRHIVYVSMSSAGPRVWVDGTAGPVYEKIGILRYSPEKDRIAYVAEENGKKFVVLDGKKEPPLKDAGSLTFSPDGTRLAYRAEDQNGNQFVIVDGKKGPKLEGIPPKFGLTFSPDSQHLAYVGISRTGSQIFILDNKKQQAHDSIVDIIFSPDSRHVAYGAKKEGWWHVVKDNKTGPPYRHVADISFSPDSKQWAYGAQKRNRLIIVKNGREIQAGDAVAKPIFSPDNSQFSYILKDGAAWYIVINGKKGPAVGRPGVLLFSAEGKHYAYSALINKYWTVISDNHPQRPQLDRIRHIAFSPFDPTLFYIGVKNDRETVFINGREGKSYESVGLPLMAPETHDIAYIAYDDDKMMMIVNGQEPDKKYDVIGTLKQTTDGTVVPENQLPFFSPQGDRLAYPTVNDKKAFMVVDGQEQKKYDAVSIPYFSPDGAHIAYMARKQDKWFIVVDGHEGEAKFDGFLKNARINFASPTHFDVLAVRTPPPSFYRLEVDITPAGKKQ